MTKTPRTSQNRPKLPRYIVAAISSAGGIEAISEFVRSIPADSKDAFLIVQHLSQHFEGRIPDLIAQETNRSIETVVDGQLLEAGKIYCFPAGHSTSVFDGRILINDEELQNLVYPADRFLESLAIDRGTSGVAVILSGTGTDGVEGARNLFSKGGRVFVQSPESAHFRGLPEAILRILPGLRGQEIPDIVATIDALPNVGRESMRPSEDFEGVILKIFEKVRHDTKIDLSSYSQKHIVGRISRRAKVAGCESLPAYIERLSADNGESMRLLNDVWTDLSSFNASFVALRSSLETCLDQLNQGDDSLPVKIWIAGCSTGEEAYVVGFIVDSWMKKNRPTQDWKLFATDINDRALKIASRGYYPIDAAADLPKQWRLEYFTESGDYISVTGKIRDRMVFAHHDLLVDAPFPQIDIVVSQNTLSVFKENIASKILNMFAMAVRKDGFLVLKEANASIQAGRYFKPTKEDIFKNDARNDRQSNKVAVAPVQQSEAVVDSSRRSPTTDPVTQSVLQYYIPASFVIATNGEVRYFFGPTAQFICPSKTSASLKLSEILALEYQHVARHLLEKISDHKEQTFSELVTVQAEEGPVTVWASIEALRASKLPEELYILQMDFRRSHQQYPSTTDSKDELGSRLRNAEIALKAAMAELDANRLESDSIVQKYEHSSQDLQMTVEQFQVATEELQATNEELQAVNEELYAVNSESQARIAELAEVSCELNNVYDCMELASIFIDPSLRVSRFNQYARRLFHLRNDEIAANIETLWIGQFPALVRSVQDAVMMNINHQYVVKNDEDETLHVSISSYLSTTKLIKGCVLFCQRFDPTKNQLLDTSISPARDRFGYVVKIDQRGRIIFADDGFSRLTGVSVAQKSSFPDLFSETEAHSILSKIKSWSKQQQTFEQFSSTLNTGSAHGTKIEWIVRSQLDLKSKSKQFILSGSPSGREN